MTDHKGFSFIELVVVVCFLGILSIFIFPNYIYLSNSSKQTAMLSHLIHIHGLFKSNYRYKGHYGGVKIPDMVLPESYCGVLIFTSKGCSASEPSHIKGSCSPSNPKSKIKVPVIKSGFMILAYGKKTKNIDISLSHKKKVFKEKIFNSDFQWTPDFKSELQNLVACQKYSKREDCRSAGCEWDGSNCGDHPNC